MPSDPIIRSVELDDYKRWLPLWDGYNAFYGRSGPTALAPEITAMPVALEFGHRGKNVVVELATPAPGRRRILHNLGEDEVDRICIDGRVAQSSGVAPIELDRSNGGTEFWMFGLR